MHTNMLGAFCVPTRTSPVDDTHACRIVQISWMSLSARRRIAQSASADARVYARVYARVDARMDARAEVQMESIKCSVGDILLHTKPGRTSGLAVSEHDC